MLIITEDPIGLDNHHELPEGDNSISFSGGSILHCPIDLCLLEACTNQNISKMENGKQLELSILLEKVTLL